MDNTHGWLHATSPMYKYMTLNNGRNISRRSVTINPCNHCCKKERYA